MQFSGPAINTLEINNFCIQDKEQALLWQNDTLQLKGHYLKPGINSLRIYYECTGILGPLNNLNETTGIE